jgi:hypothetical protein
MVSDPAFNKVVKNAVVVVVLTFNPGPLMCTGNLNLGP